MAAEKEINEAFDHFAADIPGFIAAALVDLDSGMTLAVRSTRTDFDLGVASAYNSELVKQKIKIMRALGLKTNLEDMILTLGDQIHLMDPAARVAILPDARRQPFHDVPRRKSPAHPDRRIPGDPRELPVAAARAGRGREVPELQRIVDRELILEPRRAERIGRADRDRYAGVAVEDVYVLDPMGIKGLVGQKEGQRLSGLGFESPVRQRYG